MEMYGSNVDGIHCPLPAATTPTQQRQLWETLTKQEERVVELMQEDNVDEVDELAGHEG